ncbi:hypothetical protein N7453_003936 [Penicillium expansum]|nr:hypothetical protein N7453_003936 [Penicillium expansum]
MDEWVTAYGTGLPSRFARLPPVRNDMRSEPKEKVEYSDTPRPQQKFTVLEPCCILHWIGCNAESPAGEQLTGEKKSQQKKI